MGRLFVLFFLLPWWAYVPASIGVLWVGERVYERALETEAGKAEALKAPVPDPVDLAEFDTRRDVHAAGEVHVTGWMDPDLRHELVETRIGVTTATRYMYPMFGPSEPETARVVRAALMLTKKQYETFLEQSDAFITGVTDAGQPVFTFNGFGDTHVAMGDMAADAIAELGLAQPDDFIFVAPFFEGRDAALAPHGIPAQSRYIGWAIAALVALVGVVKRVSSVRARLSRDADVALAAAGIEEIAPSPAATFSVPQGVPEDTPLGRIARRNAKRTAAQRVEGPTFASFGDPEPEPSSSAEHPEDEPVGARPALAHDDGARPAGAAGNPFPPMGEYGDMPARAPRSSVLEFYVKLLLGMLVVGAGAYDPSLINAALPVAAIALFWFGAYVVVRKLRGGAAKQVDSDERAPQHARRPDGAAQPVAAGGGGHGIDLTAPGRSTRREPGVI